MLDTRDPNIRMAVGLADDFHDSSRTPSQGLRDQPKERQQLYRSLRIFHFYSRHVDFDRRYIYCMYMYFKGTKTAVNYSQLKLCFRLYVIARLS